MELEDRQEKINSDMKDFLSSQEITRGEVEEVFNKIPGFILRGGKRVRPALFLEGYKIGEGETLEECVKASLSIELCHNYFLMHDDIMDKDELRRGGKTLHKSYEEDFDAWTSISLAINTGDYTNALSIQAILDSDFSSDRKFKAIEELVKMQKRVYEGQCLDLLLHEKPLSEVNIKDVLDLHSLKTASYTVSSPLKMGFFLSPKSEGPSSEKIREKLEAYGRKVGTAFQIKDDLLGLFGQEEETGKSVASDIEERKRTMPLVMAYSKASEKQKKKLEEVLGSKADADTVKEIREIVSSTGAKRKCEKIAGKRIKKGKEAIKPIESQFLNTLADFVVERSY